MAMIFICCVCVKDKNFSKQKKTKQNVKFCYLVNCKYYVIILQIYKMFSYPKNLLSSLDKQSFSQSVSLSISKVKLMSIFTMKLVQHFGFVFCWPFEFITSKNLWFFFFFFFLTFSVIENYFATIKQKTTQITNHNTRKLKTNIY